LWYKIGFLSKTRLGSWNVTPFLDDWLLDLSWVRAGSGADFLWNVNALLGWLEQWNQFGDVLTLSLWLQVTGLLWNLLDNSLLLVKAFFWSWLELTTGWSTKFTWDLLTFGFWRVLLDVLLLGLTDLLGPLGTLLFGGVSLGDILALLFLDGLTLNNVILNIMLVVSGLTLGFVDGLTFLWSLTFADEWSVAELDFLIRSDLLVLNETALDEVLFTFLFLLWFEVGSVSGVTSLRVAMLALNDIIVLGLLNHDNLVDTSLSGGGNGSNVQSYIIAGSLTGGTGWETEGSAWMSLMMSMMILMVGMGSLTGIGRTTPCVEWEGVPQALLATWILGRGTSGQHQKEAKFAKSVHD